MSSSSDEARKNYMKEYMRNRYHADKEKSRGYKNSLRYTQKIFKTFFQLFFRPVLISGLVG